MHLAPLADAINSKNSEFISSESLSAIKAVSAKSLMKASITNDVFDDKTKLDRFKASQRCGFSEVEKCLTIYLSSMRLELRIDQSTRAGVRLLEAVELEKGRKSCGLSASGDLKVVPIGDDEVLSYEAKGWFRVDCLSVIPCDSELLSHTLTRYLVRGVLNEFRLHTTTPSGDHKNWKEWVQLKLDQIVEEVQQ